MNYTQTIRNYISERKGEFFEITYERKKYFYMIPDKTLMKVLNRLEDEGVNLFFTTFNKYVGKDDKNQAFTPDHIVHFMCKVTNVNRNSYVLDPCCGSGAFLVRALTEARDDCDTDSDKEDISKRHIYGIEYEEKAFGLSTTNMLIHGDGNSNVIQGSCFKDLNECIGKKDRNNNDIKINVVLMNPPYNATRNQSNPEYAKTWNSKTKTDPSKGFHFVHYIANKINNGTLR